MNSTGHASPTSGIWQPNCQGKQLALSKGDIFPPCSHCHKGVSYTLVRATQ